MTAQIAGGRGRKECACEAFSLSLSTWGTACSPVTGSCGSRGFESGTLGTQEGTFSSVSSSCLCPGASDSRSPSAEWAPEDGEAKRARSGSGREATSAPRGAGESSCRRSLGRHASRPPRLSPPLLPQRAGPRGSSVRAYGVASPSRPAPWKRIEPRKRIEPQRRRPARRWGSGSLSGSSRPGGRPQPARSRHLQPGV